MPTYASDHGGWPLAKNARWRAVADHVESAPSGNAVSSQASSSSDEPRIERAIHQPDKQSAPNAHGMAEPGSVDPAPQHRHHRQNERPEERQDGLPRDCRADQSRAQRIEHAQEKGPDDQVGDEDRPGRSHLVAERQAAEGAGNRGHEDDPRGRCRSRPAVEQRRFERRRLLEQLLVVDVDVEVVEPLGGIFQLHGSLGNRARKPVMANVPYFSEPSIRVSTSEIS